MDDTTAGQKHICPENVPRKRRLQGVITAVQQGIFPESAHLVKDLVLVLEEGRKEVLHAINEEKKGILRNIDI